MEARRATLTTAHYRPHTHPTLSVGIVDVGESVTVCSGHHFPMRAGDVIVINPGEIHSCNPSDAGRWSYRMLYFDPEWAGLSAPYPRWRHPLRGRLARELVDRMMAIVETPSTSRAGDAARLRTLLARLLRLARSRSEPGSTDMATPIERVRDYLEAHCAEALPLSAVAARFGLSPFALVRQFKRRYGMTPHAFRLDQRVCRARELLKNGHDAADVAHGLGFSDQSHLVRVFKPRVAATPGQYSRSGRR